MNEIMTPIIEDDEGLTVITEDHSIADIARWIKENNWQDEVLYYLTEKV